MKTLGWVCLVVTCTAVPITGAEKIIIDTGWHDVPKANITMEVDAQGVLDLIEKTITAR